MGNVRSLPNKITKLRVHPAPQGLLGEQHHDVTDAALPTDMAEQTQIHEDG